MGVAAAVLNGVIMQLIAAATIEERDRALRLINDQLNILIEALDDYRARAARKLRALCTDEEVTGR